MPRESERRWWVTDSLAMTQSRASAAAAPVPVPGGGLGPAGRRLRQRRVGDTELSRSYRKAVLAVCCARPGRAAIAPTKPERLGRSSCEQQACDLFRVTNQDIAGRPDVGRVGRVAGSLESRGGKK